jgi:hypothetical protein
MRGPHLDTTGEALLEVLRTSTQEVSSAAKLKVALCCLPGHNVQLEVMWHAGAGCMRQQGSSASSAHVLPPDEHEQRSPVRALREDATLSVRVLGRQLPPIHADVLAIVAPQHLHHLLPAACDLCNSFTLVSGRQNRALFLDVSAACIARHEGLQLTTSSNGYSR